jgi:hypothetical protein
MNPGPLADIRLQPDCFVRRRADFGDPKRDACPFECHSVRSDSRQNNVFYRLASPDSAVFGWDVLSVERVRNLVVTDPLLP